MGFRPRISHIILILVLVLTIELRLFYSFQTPYYSTDKSYYTIREIDSITNTGIPLLEDPLKDENTFIVNPPLFYYFIAGISYLIPIGLAGKIISATLGSSLVLIVFLVAKQLTGSESAALFSSILTAFMPILFVKSALNTTTPHSLALPALFFVMYCFTKIKLDIYLYLYLAILVLLPFIHASAIILIPVYLLYMLLVKMEKIRQPRAELELILFSSLFIIWVIILFYKNAFFLYGPAIIWQNIPSFVYNNFFADTNILKATYNIGMVPVIFGIIVIYKSIFVEKNTKIYLFISLVLVTSILLYLRLIALEIGLMYLGVTLAILAARLYDGIFRYIEKTSFARFYAIPFILILMIIGITSIMPSLSYAKNTVDNSIDHDTMISLMWMKDNLKNNSIVLGLPEEGNLITAIAKKKILLDTNYLLIDNIDEIVEDIQTIYTTHYETEAIELLTKYNIDYIFFSPYAKNILKIERLEYVNDKRCFELVYDSVIQIYESKCII